MTDRQTVKRSGDVFIPVVFETYGAVGWEARKLIAEITEKAVVERERKDFKEWAFVHLSLALQKGNSLIWNAGERMARGA